MTDEQKTGQKRCEFIDRASARAASEWDHAAAMEQRDVDRMTMFAASVESKIRQAVALERIADVLASFWARVEAEDAQKQDTWKAKPPATPPTPPPAGGHKR